MEFNDKIRYEMYNYWCDASGNLIHNILDYILHKHEEENIVNQWLVHYLFDTQNDLEKIELAINILVYNYTFYYLNMDKNIVNKELLDEIDISLVNKVITSSKCKKSFDLYISKILEGINQNGLESLTIIYEEIICNTHRKENGEYYTEDSISKLITFFSIKSNDQKLMNVLDPMCGTGMFLRNLQGYISNKASIWGIEKNKFTSYVCNRVLQNNNISNNNINIINNNLFSTDIERNKIIETVAGVKRIIPSEGFDLIIGNPAYIRYQALGYIFNEIPKYIKDHYVNLGRKLESSTDYVTFVGLYIRALLLCKENYSNQILEKIGELLKKGRSNNRESDLDTIIKSYSGLSDSTVPTWFLSYKLCKDNGIIAYITSDSWLKKDYGNILKKFFALYTKLKCVFDMSNVNCFKDAQVNTSIVICEKNLNIRQNIVSNVKFIKFKGDHGKNVELSESINKILLKNSIDIGDTDSVYTRFKEFIYNLCNDYEDEYINVKIVKQKDLIKEEGKIIEWGAHFESRTVLDKIINSDWKYTEECGISVNQGLRTGFNNFFYFDSVNIDTLINKKLIASIPDCNFGDKRWEELSKEEKLKIKFNNILYLPEDYIDNIEKYMLLMFKYEDDNIKKVAITFINKNNLRKGIKSIKSINFHSVTEEKGCYILDMGKSVIKDDYNIFAKEYSEYLDDWINGGFKPTCRSIDAYIKFYSKLKIKKGNGYIYVKDMPVLRGYENKPSKEKIPTKWYNLSFTGRHLPDMFLNRINYKDVNVVLNTEADRYVIDANFNTITLNNKNFNEKMIYFAVFNSTMFKLQLENNCANLGGGALKVETSGVKKCKLPSIDKFSLETQEKLILLSYELYKKTLNDTEVIKKIDSILVNEILGEGMESIVNDLAKEYTLKVKERTTK